MGRQAKTLNNKRRTYTEKVSEIERIIQKEKDEKEKIQEKHIKKSLQDMKFLFNDLIFKYKNVTPENVLECCGFNVAETKEFLNYIYYDFDYDKLKTNKRLSYYMFESDRILIKLRNFKEIEIPKKLKAKLTKEISLRTSSSVSITNKKDDRAYTLYKVGTKVTFSYYVPQAKLYVFLFDNTHLFPLTEDEFEWI